MKIKRFNENFEIQNWNKKSKMIYCIIVSDISGFIEDIEENNSAAYDNLLDAANHYIKWVNYFEDTEFEPMKDEDGTRFFTSVEENEDWEKCIEHVEESGLNIKLIEIPLF